MAIVHQNVQCLGNSVNEVTSFLETIQECKIVCISEHRQCSEQLETLKLPNLKLVSSFCRPIYEHGGVAIYCEENINTKLMPWVSEFVLPNIFECCAVKISMKSFRFVVLCVYHPSGSDDAIFLDRLNSLLNALNKEEQTIYITGDFNIDTLTDTKFSRNFLYILSSYNLVLTINDITRPSKSGGTCIDNIITNSPIEYVVQNIDTCISDHRAQIIYFCIKAQNEQCSNLVRIFSDASINEFCNDLRDEIFPSVYESVSVDSKYAAFMNILSTYINKHFPQKIASRPPDRRKYFQNPEIKQCRDKMIMYQSLSMSLPHFKGLFKESQCHYKNLLKNERTKHLENKLKQSKNKTRTSWAIINEFTSNTKKKSHQPNFGNNFTEGVNNLNSFFNKKAHDLINATYSSSTKFQCNIPYNDVQFRFRHICTNTLETYVNNLEAKKSYGYDEVSTSLLKKCFKHISEPLVHIINASLNDGWFPTSLKFSQIRACFKKGDPDSFDNYRPISLLSSFSKLFELVVYNQILTFFTDNNVLNKNQHGFMKGKSTETAVFELTNNIHQDLDNNNVVCGIFLDLSRAFDCIDFEILFVKLEHYGIRGTELEWFKSYMTNRQHSLKMKNPRTNKYMQSGALGTSMGVPQGSVLGPLIFNIYINDLTTLAKPNQRIINYADDTSVLLTAENFPKLLIDGNDMMVEIHKWFSNSKLILNPDKTNAIFFKTNRGPDTPNHICLNKQVISFKEHHECLGFTLDETLKFDLHIDLVCRKLSRACYGLRVLARNTNGNITMIFYYSNFYSIARYGILLWGGSGDIDEVFKIQKRAVRIMRGLDCRESCRTHFKALRILTIPALYIFECIKFIIKNPNYFDIYLAKHHYNTRHIKNYNFPRHHLSSFEKGALYSCIKIFNHLPATLKSTNNFSDIKKLLIDILCKLEPYSVAEYLDKPLNY